jgi:predicted homoserine dehydrogenase-like protein
MVYWGDAKAIGVAPYASTFQVDPRQAAQDVARQKFLVVWASGAKLETTETWKPKENKRWKFTFSRPVNAAGLDVDLKYATAQETARAQQQAARAQQESLEQQRRDAALGQMLDGLNRGLGNNSVNCTSIAYSADWVRTTCR